MKDINNITDVIRKTTMTFSCPLKLAAWLKRSQRNISAFVVEAVEEKRQREDKDDTQVQKTT